MACYGDSFTFFLILLKTKFYQIEIITKKQLYSKEDAYPYDLVYW
jgi:hypothetical protein